MSALAALDRLFGKWQGTNQLWLYPWDPVHQSDTWAEIAVTAQGQFSELRYAWAYEGEPQEGKVILGFEAGSGVVKAVWFDTWHMANDFMICAGELDPEGTVCIRGSYPAPEGPDWGWQISIETWDKDAFRMLMHNITPAGEEFLAVEAAYHRQE